MRYLYMMPGNEDEFEEFCLRFYRCLFKKDTIARYGKRGQRQFGIDLIDLLHEEPVYAVQCKHHEPHKALGDGEITAEVKKAEAAPHKPHHYIVATTAQKSTRSQDEVISLNNRLGIDRKFIVEVHFWEDICARLAEFDPAIADFVHSGRRTEEAELKLVYFSSSRIRLLAPEVSSPLESPYSYIINLLDERKVEAAQHEFQKLPAPESPGLAREQKYAVLRIRGKLAIEHQEYEEAARSFLDAYEAWPDLEQAQLNRILALGLLDDRTQAFVEAEKLVIRGDRSKTLANLLLRNARDLSDIERHFGLISQYLDDAEICTTLAQQYLNFNDLENAQSAIDSALKLDPQSAHTHLVAAMISHHAGLEGQITNRREELVRALEHYSKAISFAERDRFFGVLPEALSNRARVHGYFGKMQKASEDYRRAVATAHSPPMYAPDAVHFFLSVGDYESAKELLPNVQQDSEGEFLRAVVEYQGCSSDAERTDVIRKLLAVCEHGGDRAVEARLFCVSWALEIHDYDLALQCITAGFLAEYPFQANVLLSWIALDKGEKQAASHHANQALQENPSSATRQEIAVLASVLTHLEDDEKALPLWDQARLPGTLDGNCKRLLECAQRLDRHDVLIRICEELRNNNAQDNQVRKLEVQVLSRYLPSRAFELADEYIKFDAPYFTAARNFVAVKLNLLDRIETDVTKLPNAGQLDPAESYLFVIPLVKAKCFGEAIRFAYHQLRKHFGDERAHTDFMFLILQRGGSSELCQAPQSVRRDSAVYLENVVTEQRRWLIIEEDQPEVSLSEIGPQSSLVQAVLDHKVGDIVELTDYGIQKTKERILEIQSKYIRVFQDCIQNFQNRFPGATAIQQVNLSTYGELDPTILLESLKDRRDFVNSCFEFYLQNPSSIHLLAFRIGTSVLQTMKGLIANEAWAVNCTSVDFLQFNQLVSAGTVSTKIVLDIVAIVTISLLDAWELLDKSKEYITSQSTINLIRQWIDELPEFDGQGFGHAFATDDDRFVMTEVTEEEIAAQRDELQNIQFQVSNLCSVATAPAIAALDPARRSLYEKMFGYAALEVVMIAHEQKAILWTDDLFVGYWAASEFQLARIWTQLALKIAISSKEQMEKYQTATAKLIEWKYVNTIWDAETLLFAGKSSKWDFDAQPLKQCFALLAGSQTPRHIRTRICMEVLYGVSYSCSRQLQPLVIRQALDSLGDIEAARWMSARIWRLFSQDADSATFFQEEIAAWVRFHE